jgi:hypothetical protein
VWSPECEIIYGYKEEEVRGGWKKLHIEELHDLYSSQDNSISGKMRWAGHVAGTVKKKNAY